MFEFKNELTQADWMAFKSEFENVFEKRIKNILQLPPSSDVHEMVSKLEFYSGWWPWISTERAKAERFYKMARAEALADCPHASPELKVRIWLEGEIADIEYQFNRIDAIYRAGTDSGQKLQTCLRVELDLKNISGRTPHEHRD